MHAAADWPLRGLALLTGRLLDCRLCLLPHLIDSPELVIPNLSTLRFPLGSNARLVKLDIKEFFMSGTPSELAATASGIFRVCFAEETDTDRVMLWGKSIPRAQIADWIRKALEFLMRYQFVEADNRRLFHVTIGTGMGLPHSGYSSYIVLSSLEPSSLPLPLPSPRPLIAVSYFC